MQLSKGKLQRAQIPAFCQHFLWEETGGKLLDSIGRNLIPDKKNSQGNITGCMWTAVELGENFAQSSSLLLFSCSAVSDSFVTPETAACCLSCPSLSPGFCSNHVHWRNIQNINLATFIHGAPFQDNPSTKIEESKIKQRKDKKDLM